MASQDLMAYWGTAKHAYFWAFSCFDSLTDPGYKFESISVLRQPWDPTPRHEIETRDEEIVNNSAQYCSVVRTGIGNVKMVIGGEVDAGMS